MLVYQTPKLTEKQLSVLASLYCGGLLTMDDFDPVLDNVPLNYRTVGALIRHGYVRKVRGSNVVEITARGSHEVRWRKEKERI